MPAPLAALAPLAISVFGGALKGLFGNKAKKNEAENNRLLMQHGIDTKNLSRKRKASLVGSLLRTFTAHPETYGKFVSNDMFGYMPGPLTEQDYVDPAAPKFKAQSNLSAMLSGAGAGVGDYMSDRGAAEAEMMGRVRGTGPTSAGQPIGASSISGSGGIRRTGGMYPDDEVA